MNIGILLWTEVVCTQCNKTTAGEFIRHGRRQMRMVKADLHKQGWIVVKGHPICPDCINLDHSMGIKLPTPIKGQQ
jgi:hypothetical protein